MVEGVQKVTAVRDPHIGEHDEVSAELSCCVEPILARWLQRSGAL